ncbi:hypothetical protein ABT071_36705 [Streptomyces sp. NPDC002506]|uniref:hypothetical protein n=1 Tax=unclassified Streptomyces TaxID=2593676 RepID=UPI00131AFD9D|nr:hypothetical protein [Streptomyces sp. CB01201]
MAIPSPSAGTGTINWATLLVDRSHAATRPVVLKAGDHIETSVHTDAAPADAPAAHSMASPIRQVTA